MTAAARPALIVDGGTAARTAEVALVVRDVLAGIGLAPTAAAAGGTALRVAIPAEDPGGLAERIRELVEREFPEARGAVAVAGAPAEAGATSLPWAQVEAAPEGGWGDALDTYRSMRDFAVTAEPAGAPPAAGEGTRFVIQQHDATALHWDLRLEHEGVLESWAVPRGLPLTPARNHLAVHTEDHPLEYLDFAGAIPPGEYGGGHMTVWDTGTYETVERKEGKRVVVLHGGRAEGRYALFATGKQGGRDWMIHRMDPPADPDRREPPVEWRPMGVVEGPLPAGDDHAFELWWPGLRVLVVNTPGDTVLLDAGGTNISKGFVEIRRLARALGSTEVVLDGVVVEHRDGVPVDEPVGLDRRAAGVSDSVRRRLARDHPVRLLAFDLLWRDGYPRIDRPWHERRAELEELGLADAAWQVPRATAGDGADLLAAVAARGGRGLVAKRRDAPYRPGRATGDWVAVRA